MQSLHGKIKALRSVSGCLTAKKQRRLGNAVSHDWKGGKVMLDDMDLMDLSDLDLKSDRGERWIRCWAGLRTKEKQQRRLELSIMMSWRIRGHFPDRSLRISTLPCLRDS